MSPSVRIVVVEDHGVVREGIAALLERQPNLTVVGFAGTGRQAVAAAVRLKPDVVVMDLVLPDLGGIDATERILRDRPQTGIVILSTHHTNEHAYRTLRAGARGYLANEAVGADLVRAVAIVHHGGRFVSPDLPQEVLDGIEHGSAQRSPLERLSMREREVLNLTATGSTSAQIARQLSLSPKTVDTYRSRVMHKLGVSDHAGLIRFAVVYELNPV